MPPLLVHTPYPSTPTHRLFLKPITVSMNQSTPRVTHRHKGESRAEASTARITFGIDIGRPIFDKQKQVQYLLKGV